MRSIWLPCATIVVLSLVACSFGDSSPEVVPPEPTDVVVGPEPIAATEVAVDDTSCCCAYIQETSQEKTYDSMVARNCTEWGFECVDDGFCDGTMAAAVPEPAVEPATAPSPTPAPAAVSPRPAPRPSPRPSGGGMTRPR